MLNKLRNRHFFLIDVLLLPVAAYFSYVLRLERLDLGEFWPSYSLFAATAVLVTPFIFRRVGLYARYWAYASVPELLMLTGAMSLSTISCGLVNLGVLWLVTSPTFVFPRSVPFIFLLLGLVVTAGPRLTAHIAHLYTRPGRHGNRPTRPVLIMGAGDAGSQFLRELQRNPHLGLEVVAFLDDDPDKRALNIHGVPVLGTRHDIPHLVREYGIQQVIIAMPTASGQAIRGIVQICEQTNVQTKIMPGLYSLLDGSVSVRQLRDVEIEDLLRREPVKTDITAVRQLVQGKRVLVTGGGGSIGSELCRQLFSCTPAQLILLGRGENSVFSIYHELKTRLSGSSPTQITAVIADVRFPDRLHTIFEVHRPEIVFHTAAHKHVPLMELHPSEAVINNVIGTRNLLNVALAHGTTHFVMISTDKAVNPTSAMGASKRCAELLVHQAARRSGRPYVAVRFGNVLGSRGSVVHTFQRQIASGGPVTVTHPEIERFFMTIPEATQLVLQAAAIGQGDEVFVLDMGEPVRIVDLARDLIELSGLQPERDIDIIFTGLRPGEKLYEELFIPGEAYKRTRHQKIFIAENASSFIPPDLTDVIATLEAAAYRADHPAIYRYFKRLIPEYQPPITFKAKDIAHS